MTGLYFYDNQVLDIAARLEALGPRRAGNHRRQPRVPAPRSTCTSKCFSRGFAWLDTGTHESLLQASNFIETIEQRQGLKIACLEEVAFHKGFIDAEQFEGLARPLKNSYGDYLRDLLKRPHPDGK